VSIHVSCSYQTYTQHSAAMSCKLSKGGISQPPGPEEETVDMAELLNGKVLEAGNTPSYHGRADSKSMVSLPSKSRAIY